MVEIRRILCPTDYSTFSRRALDHAVAIARWYGSTITVLHVNPVLPLSAYTPVSPIVPPALLTPPDRDATIAALKQFAAEESAPGVAMEFDTVEGRPANEIVARANAMGSDLIVLGTHGYSGFDRVVLGSVAEKVLRKAECPVLTVPCHAPDAAPIPSALFKQILCPVDFSPSSMRAFNYALSLAQEADAHVTILHALELPPGTAADLGDTIELPRELRRYVDDVEKDRQARLKEIVPDSARTYCTIETVLTTGTPHRTILRIAEERGAGLIVMGVHGRAALDLVLFGSTTNYVVRRATCPVMTLRAV